MNEHSAIPPEMAIRLSTALGSTPEMWLRMQMARDLAQVRDHAAVIKVPRYEPPQSLPRDSLAG